MTRTGTGALVGLVVAVVLSFTVGRVRSITKVKVCEAALPCPWSFCAAPAGTLRLHHTLSHRWIQSGGEHQPALPAKFEMVAFVAIRSLALKSVTEALKVIVTGTAALVGLEAVDETCTVSAE